MLYWYYTTRLLVYLPFTLFHIRHGNDLNSVEIIWGHVFIWAIMFTLCRAFSKAVGTLIDSSLPDVVFCCVGLLRLLFDHFMQDSTV